VGVAAVDKKRVGRPTQLDTLRKSEAVLEVATDLFVERGFNGTTMEAVAHAADIGKQALYMRFPDKESLFTAVIERLKDDEVFKHLPPAADDLPVQEGFRNHLRAILADSAQPKSVLVCKLVMREGHRFPGLVSLIGEAALERFIGPLAAYLEQRRLKGEIRDIDTLATAGMCADLVFAEVTRAMFREVELSTEEVVQSADRIAELVFCGIGVGEDIVGRISVA
jgi:AcrR family transcriptional regulator